MPELVKHKLLNEGGANDPHKASFLGILEKGQKRKRMVTMIGGGANIDEELEVEEDDPFLAVQKDLVHGLRTIR